MNMIVAGKYDVVKSETNIKKRNLYVYICK